MEQNIQSAYQEELQRLEETAAEIERQIKMLEGIPRYYGNDFTEQILDDLRGAKDGKTLPLPCMSLTLEDLILKRKAQTTCFLFISARLELKMKRQVTPSSSIIGRAPIASLFYSFTGGEDTASYESPDGTIEGLVHLKRNLVVRQKLLQRVVDSYVRGKDNLGVADEFLLYRLEDNKDNRLRDIVSTIQEEQDRIIKAGEK